MEPSSLDRPYAGIFLSEESQLRLLEWWRAVVRKPLLQEILVHHVTLVYDPTVGQTEQVPLGAEGTIEVVGWAADEHGQAVLVRSDPVSINAFPHITVATDGTPAVYSNLLLQQGYVPVAGPKLRGVVDIRI